MNSVKRLTSLSAVIVLVGAVFLVTPVALAAEQSTTQTTTTTKTTEKPAAKIADRIAKYKTKQEVKLAAAEELKLKGVCKAAQVKLKKVDTATSEANTDRTKTYAGITKQIDGIITKLKDASVDTKELEANQKALKALIQQYNDDYTVFKTDLTDVSELDCVTDPVAFKSALLVAREDRLTVVKDATAIREYITTIKQSLLTARISLAARADAKDTTKKDATDTTTTTTDSTGDPQ